MDVYFYGAGGSLVGWLDRSVVIVSENIGL